MLKRKLLITLLAIVTAVTTVFSIACGPSDLSSESSSSNNGGNVGGGDTGLSHVWTDMPENTTPNLKYFGYFHSDGFRSQPSYIEEIEQDQWTSFVVRRVD